MREARLVFSPLRGLPVVPAPQKCPWSGGQSLTLTTIPSSRDGPSPQEHMKELRQHFPSVGPTPPGADKVATCRGAGL